MTDEERLHNDNLEVIRKLKCFIEEYESGSIGPDDFKKELSRAYSRKRGAKPDSNVHEREIEITRTILENEMLPPDSPYKKSKTSFISDYAYEIEDKYGRRYSDSDIFKIYDRNKFDVMSDIVAQQVIEELDNSQ